MILTAPVMGIYYQSRPFLSPFSRKFACFAGLAAFCAVVPASLLAQELTEERVQGKDWWPTQGRAPRSEYTGPEACTSCHAAQAASYAGTPMARAAVPAENDQVLSSHAAMAYQLGPYAYSINRTGDQRIYSVTDGTKTISAPLLWAFGQGLGFIGQTYLYRYEGSLYETRVSYYDRLGGLDITPGHERKVPGSLEDAHGNFLHDSVARQCFACHNTASITEDRLTPEQMIIGVTCEACHGPGAKHVALLTAGGKENADKLIFNPTRLKPKVQTDFCGACHRTWWDVKLLDVRGLDNVRFHPYRLQSSRCWTVADQRIACQACHDPHGPPAGTHIDYDEKCMACHAAAASLPEKPAATQKPCPVAKKDCVGCHMPKYEPPAMHFKFTDHWIRVVRADETYPE